MSYTDVPKISLNSDVAIPQLGLGTYLMRGEECVRAVSAALDMGYTHLDTATVYENEAEVGQAIQSSKVSRSDVFLTTKLANSDQRDPHGAFKESLRLLDTDYVDLYLLHWPLPKRDTALGAWEGILEIFNAGQARAVGVCNFEIEHLEMLHDETGVYPSVNQIELHPEHQRRELVAFCQEKNIAVQAWGPLAQMKSDLLQRPEITVAAELLDKTPAQIVLRWHIEKGNIVIPKSANVKRLRENMNIFDFELTETMISDIDLLEVGKNYGPNPNEYDG